MPFYDFACECGNTFDKFVRFFDLDVPVHCKCGKEATRLMCCPNMPKDLAYNFTDMNTTGKPVEIRSKGQWKKHLKSLGLTDDIPQTPPKKNELKQLKSEPSKKERIAGHKKTIEGVLRERGKIR